MLGNRSQPLCPVRGADYTAQGPAAAVMHPLGSHSGSCCRPALWVETGSASHRGPIALSAMRRLTILTMLLLFALAVAASAKAPTARFKTGSYSAKTAQGAHFKFKIEGHTAADHCGSSASNHCFIAISYPTISEPCTTGPSGGGTFDVPNGFINGKGNFSYHQSLSGSQQPLIAFTAHASGSKVTGTLREKDDNGPGATCDTGTVRWTAHRV
jgi:hypothetical protein